MDQFWCKIENKFISHPQFSVASRNSRSVYTLPIKWWYGAKYEPKRMQIKPTINSQHEVLKYLGPFHQALTGEVFEVVSPHASDDQRCPCCQAPSQYLPWSTSRDHPHCNRLDEFPSRLEKSLKPLDASPTWTSSSGR